MKMEKRRTVHAWRKLPWIEVNPTLGVKQAMGCDGIFWIFRWQRNPEIRILKGRKQDCPESKKFCGDPQIMGETE